MKKLTVCMIAVFTLLILIPSQLKAAIIDTTALVIAAKADSSAKATVLVTRLYQINAMDISSLSTSEKRQLRKEVRSINANLKDWNGGIYLSVGAVIIIILLLILLL